jgi:hypothetical protein
MKKEMVMCYQLQQTLSPTGEGIFEPEMRSNSIPTCSTRPNINNNVETVACALFEFLKQNSQQLRPKILSRMTKKVRAAK